MVVVASCGDCDRFKSASRYFVCFPLDFEEVADVVDVILLCCLLFVFYFDYLKTFCLGNIAKEHL